MKTKLSIFLILFSFSFASSNIEDGDLCYAKQNYIQAIANYKKAYINKKPKARIKLIMSYLKLGDNFNKTKRYDEALNWYNKALKLKSKVAQYKISIVYANQADIYVKIKQYENALDLYNKSLKLKNKSVIYKIKTTKAAISHIKKLKNDTRKIVTDNSPIWTNAIGRLIIPTKLDIISSKRYKINFKKCSASIINFPQYDSSKVIVTASHCLTDYNNKAGGIRFIIKNSQSEMIQRYAKVYKDSHYSSKKLKTVSDYAILILDKAISSRDIKPLILKKNDFIELEKKYKYSFGSLAGFSGDIGEYGAKLTYDPKCELNYFSSTYGISSCSGYKGASGGPVMMSVSDDNINYDYYFVGVISHFRKNNFKHIFFAPHNIFYKELKDVINKSQYI